MARLVVLEFDDDQAADRFVAHMANRMGAGALNQASVAIAYSSVVGVFARPTKFCKCKNPNSKNFTKSAKFGWWIHKPCSKPLPMWGEPSAFQKLISSAYNLLPRKKEDDADTTT